MNNSTLESFFRGDYMPHGHCYLWQPSILITHVVSDLLIATAYFSIPVGILFFLKKRQDIKHQKIFFMFSLFILFCGITHLMGIWTIWQGVYGLHGIAKASTAFVSITTAFMLFKLIPSVLQIPSADQFKGVTNELNKLSGENRKLNDIVDQQNLFTFTLNAIPTSVLIVNKHGEIQLFNERFIEEFDISPSSLVGQSILSFVHCDDIQFTGTFTQSDDLLEFGYTHYTGGLLVDNQTTPVAIELCAKQYQNEILILVSLSNLAEITNMKQELVDSHSRLERAINATEDGIWEWNIEKNLSRWSNKLFELIGATPEQKAHFDVWFDHIHPDYRERVKQAIHGHFTNKERYYVEYKGKNANGDYDWFVSVGNSVFDEEGNARIMSGSLRSIQSFKEMEAANEEKNNFLNAIYNGSNLAIWAVEVLPDDDFKFVIYNQSSLDRTSTTPEQVINKKLSQLSDDIFSTEIKHNIRSNYLKCVSTRKEHSYIEYLDSEGTVWTQTSLMPVFDTNGMLTHIIGNAIDISEQKRIEQQLKRNRDFLETILNNAVCGLYIFNLKKNKHVRINRMFSEILGHTLSDLRKVKELTELYHPDDFKKIAPHFDGVSKKKLGELIPNEYRLKHKNGNWVTCYSNHSFLSFDTEGQPELILGTFIDVTELNVLMDQLRESNDSLERFAFAASHDLQEPLRKISAFSASLSERLSATNLDKDSAFELDRLCNASKRMREMIQDLLALSRISSQQLNKRAVHFDDLIKVVIDDLSLSIEETLTNITYNDLDVVLSIDQNLMQKAFQNLISNSIKFRQPNCHPNISITLKRTVGNVEITLRDNGIGIEKENTQRIFDPFCRLNKRDQYDGSGIGLSIVRQVIKAHGGNIRCSSTLGEGTEFVITLPEG